MRPMEPSLEDLLQHASWLKNLARSLVKDPDLADDLVQQTWVTALERPPQASGNLQGWLGRVLRNTAFSRHRSEQRRLERESQSHQPDGGSIAHEVVERGETSRLLVEAVMRLDEPYRSTLLMRYHEEMTPKEIAARLSVPAGTVRARLKRGLEKLRVDISQRWGRSWNKCNLALLSFAGSRRQATVLNPLNQILLPVAAILVIALLVLQPWASDERPTVDELEVQLASADSSSSGALMDGFVADPEQRILIPSIPLEVPDQVSAELVASGGVVYQSGILRFGNSIGAVNEIPVIKGKLTFDASEQGHVLSPRFAAWFVPEHGFAFEVYGATLNQNSDGNDVLHLNLGEAVDINVHVTDLQGKAIADAELILVGAYQPPSLSARTDVDGYWSGMVMGNFPMEFFVNAPGYKSSSFEILSGSILPQAFDVQMGRVSGVVQICDRREYASKGGNWGNSSMSFYFRTEADRALRHQVEAKVEIDPDYEYFSWKTVVEKNWTGKTFTARRSHPNGLVPPQSIDLHARHLLDPTLIPSRYPGEWPHELYPVDLKLTPMDEFLASEFPASILLSWHPSSGSREEAMTASGRLLPGDGLVYRFFMPVGIYSIGSAPNDRSNSRSPKAPKVIDTEDVSVGPIVDSPPQHEVRLKDGQFYAGYLIQDEAGAPLASPAMLIEANYDDRQEHKMASWFPDAKYRFFEEGAEFELHLAKRRGRGGWIEPTGMRTVITPPQEGGIIKISIPRPDLLRFRDPPK